MNLHLPETLMAEYLKPNTKGYTRFETVEQLYNQNVPTKYQIHLRSALGEWKTLVFFIVSIFLNIQLNRCLLWISSVLKCQRGKQVMAFYTYYRVFELFKS